MEDNEINTDTVTEKVFINKPINLSFIKNDTLLYNIFVEFLLGKQYIQVFSLYYQLLQ